MAEARNAKEKGDKEDDDGEEDEDNGEDGTLEPRDEGLTEAAVADSLFGTATSLLSAGEGLLEGGLFLKAASETTVLLRHSGPDAERVAQPGTSPRASPEALEAPRRAAAAGGRGAEAR